MRRSRPWFATTFISVGSVHRFLVALAGVIVTAIAIGASARSALAAPMPGERAATLERQITEKKHTIAQLEARNVELQRAVDANPADAGANLAARQEIRQNARYIAGYKSEVSDLERALARLHAAEAGAEPAAPSAKRPPPASPPRPPPRVPENEAEPASVTAVTATRASQPGPAGRGALDTAQVHELMRSWALGRGGVPGAIPMASGAAPLAVLIGALDWRLDWRALSVGVVLGAALGAALPVALLGALRRRRPQRAPVVGSLSRKWASLAGAAGAPSKQWSELAAKAAMPIRIGALASGMVAVVAMASALASFGGFGASPGTPGLWGEAAELVLAITLAVAAHMAWRRRALAAAVGALSLLVLAAVVPITLSLTPFGGPGSVAWGVILAVAAALQVPAVVALWTLATPRAVGEARNGIALAGAVVGALVGLAGAALHLLAV